MLLFKLLVSDAVGFSRLTFAEFDFRRGCCSGVWLARSRGENLVHTKLDVARAEL